MATDHMSSRNVTYPYTTLWILQTIKNLVNLSGLYRKNSINEKDRSWRYWKLQSLFISIITSLIDFDLIIFLGSDKRVEVAEKLFSIQVIGVEIGKSPITEDRYVDPELISKILKEAKIFSSKKGVI